MKTLTLLLGLIAASAFAATSKDAYDDAMAKAQIDYKRAQKECKAMPEKERFACMKRTEQMWQEVHNGLKKQHLGQK